MCMSNVCWWTDSSHLRMRMRMMMMYFSAVDAYILLTELFTHYIPT